VPPFCLVRTLSLSPSHASRRSPFFFAHHGIIEQDWWGRRDWLATRPRKNHARIVQDIGEVGEEGGEGPLYPRDRTRIVGISSRTNLAAIGTRETKCHVVYRDDSPADARNIGILRLNWFSDGFLRSRKSHAKERIGRFEIS